MTTMVKITTSIAINDDCNNDVGVTINENGDLELAQDNDGINLLKDGAIALARIILQHHQVGFDPVYIPEVSYTA